ncbi:hypothetical protein SAMN05421829_101124 [Aromatoleum tolulyticum]|uniref:GmrSD restriction endonucleases N-terminal domain-containing protein n=1 Tax=Aromatoleum tolulyticum TaxID=34027 RepID=A0A1N6N6Q3_9RHOO|nr:DUF262 domain-containing protein [Aromatoleum tolulyticum]SIP87709.1 hypothetical protein SAMN05421829_101124 [Aromatoleum tolulyticum]
MSQFDSTKRSLDDVLKDVSIGKIQLPDFQRGWVWDDSHVRSLLVSIARSFPVGAVMLLETGGETRFQIRPVEGVKLPANASAAELLILDGQQRLTTLTQVLAIDAPVATRNEKGRAIERHYYWDIQRALEGVESLDEAIIAVEADKCVRENFGRDIKLDLSTPEKEYQQLYFPCRQTLNSDAWEEGLQEACPEQFATYMKFRKQVLQAFRGYQLPVIQLHKTTSKEAVCLVFEKVNTGGVPLNVFELVTATYAADGYNLRDDWFGSGARKVDSRQKRLAKEPVLTVLESTDFLQAIAMLHTLKCRQADLVAGKTGKQMTPVSAKRATILEMPLAAYKEWADAAEEGFKRAAKLLKRECVRDARDLPYRTQLAPLAAVLALLEERWKEPRIYDKLVRWYWCGVLGELYGGAVETRIANDMEDLLTWIEGDDEAAEPRTIHDAAFRPDRLDRMTSRLSAAYKGLNVLLLRSKAADFFWKGTISELDSEDVALDIHHIFPQNWCENERISRKQYNTVVNKTPLSYKANRMIGGVAPSAYLAKLQKHEQVKIDDAAMDSILRTHAIDPSLLRSDDFHGFYAHRKQALLMLIGQAMGKDVQQAEALAASEVGAYEEDEDEAQAA